MSVSAILQLIYSYCNVAVLSDVSCSLALVVPYTAAAFTTSYFVNEKRMIKVFWCTLCLLILSAVSSLKLSFFFGIIISLICVYFFNHFNIATSFTVTLLCSIIFGLLFGLLSDYFSDFQMSVAHIISNKGIFSTVLFSSITLALSLFGNNSFANLFFYNSYGGTIISGDDVVTGVKDLFAGGHSSGLISSYLSGHYFFLFALAGIVICLCDELKKGQKIALIIVTVCTIVSGNCSLLLLFVFLESWQLFFSAIFIGILSYTSASILDIGMGYLFDGGVIEMVLNINKPLYLLVGGVIFVAIGYFFTKYSSLKYGLSDNLNIYIPNRLNKLVNALGGIVNIIKIKDDMVEVRNPKLVNNFDIDCEIRENQIKVNNSQIYDLSDYI